MNGKHSSNFINVSMFSLKINIKYDPFFSSCCLRGIVVRRRQTELTNHHLISFSAINKIYTDETII